MLAPPNTAQPFNHPMFDPLWTLCQDLDIAVALHPATHVDFANAVGSSTDQPRGQRQRNDTGPPNPRRGAISHAVGAPVDAIVSMGRFIMGGVCERFPRLRLLFLGGGGGRAPAILHSMDAESEPGDERRWLSLLPSEYFERQCWISFSPDDPTLLHHRRLSRRRPHPPGRPTSPTSTGSTPRLRRICGNHQSLSLVVARAHCRRQRPRRLRDYAFLFSIDLRP